MTIDPWILDINALYRESRDFPYRSNITGYGMSTFQNIEKGLNYTIKFGCAWNNGNPRYYIHADVVMLVRRGFQDLDYEQFERAYRLVKALRDAGYHLGIWGLAVEGDLVLEPEVAQFRLNELKAVLEEMFGEGRPTALLRSRFSYEELEWD